MTLANRKPELDLFAQMVARQTPKRILLIEAESGLGKTDLLARFGRDCPPNTLLVRVDLKAAQSGIAYVFWRVREDMAQIDFPRFSAEVKQLLRGENVRVANNWVLGKQDIQVVLSGDDQTRAFRLTALQEAFFEDLRDINQTVVIILDTFNAAVAELENWVGGGFLAAAVRTPRLVVIVAGQRVPSPNIEWIDHYERRHLERIYDADAWFAYAQDVGLPIGRDVIAAITVLFDGRPLDIRNAFETLAKERGL